MLIKVGNSEKCVPLHFFLTGGSYTLMAWAGLVGQSSLIFTLFALPLLNDTFGHVPVVVMACVLTGIGCIISGLITNPVWMIPAIFLRGEC